MNRSSRAYENTVLADETPCEANSAVDSLVSCPRGKAKECLDSPDGEHCACCGCTEMMELVEFARVAICGKGWKTDSHVSREALTIEEWEFVKAYRKHFGGN